MFGGSIGGLLIPIQRREVKVSGCMKTKDGVGAYVLVST